MRAKPFADPDLGELVRRRRMGRGQLLVGGVRVPLAIPGGRGRPDPDAVAMARTIPASYDGWRSALVEMLADHRPDPGSSVSLVVPAPLHAAVITLDGELTVELGYRVDRDEEHTLGARFRGTEAVELCGSVLEP